MDKYLKIGEILENGTIEKEETEDGFIYKDEEAFVSKKGVCYVSELDDTPYTYKDFIELTLGSQEIAKRLFYSLRWESPGTKLEELISEDEVHECSNCNKMFLSYEIDNCPYCNSEKKL